MELKMPIVDSLGIASDTSVTLCCFSIIFNHYCNYSLLIPLLHWFMLILILCVLSVLGPGVGGWR